MTHFKNTNKKLEKLRGIFFQVGLIVAGGLTLVAFEWTSPVYLSTLDGEIVEEMEWDYNYVEPFEIDRNKPKEEKIEPPKVKSTELEIVPDDTKEPDDNLKKDDIKDPDFNPGEWETPTTDPTPPDPVFLTAGVMPHFKDCEDMDEGKRKACTQKRMFQYFGKSINIPENIKMLGAATYKAFVYFEVNKKGEIVNIKIMNDKKHSIPKELERQAYNAVNSLPQMNPGKNHGKPVRIKYSVPIVFNVI